jgi:hypothetical protein
MPSSCCSSASRCRYFGVLRELAAHKRSLQSASSQFEIIKYVVVLWGENSIGSCVSLVLTGVPYQSASGSRRAKYWYSARTATKMNFQYLVTDYLTALSCDRFPILVDA